MTDPTLQNAPVQDTLFPDVDNSDVTPEPEVDETAEKIKALEAQIQEARDRENRLQETLSNVAKAPQQQPQQQFEPQETEAPDPITDPEGYAAHIENKITQKVESRLNTVNSETQLQRTYDDMWKEFAKDNPDLANEHIGLVKYNATELLREAQAAGHDPKSYLLTNKGGFMRDLAEKTNGMISKIKGDSVNTGRTTGIPGSSPRHVEAKKTPVYDGVSTFVGELEKAQQATGFF